MTVTGSVVGAAGLQMRAGVALAVAAVGISASACDKAGPIPAALSVEPIVVRLCADDQVHVTTELVTTAAALIVNSTCGEPNGTREYAHRTVIPAVRFGLEALDEKHPVIDAEGYDLPGRREAVFLSVEPYPSSEDEAKYRVYTSQKTCFAGSVGPVQNEDAVPAVYVGDREDWWTGMHGYADDICALGGLRLGARLALFRIVGVRRISLYNAYLTVDTLTKGQR